MRWIWAGALALALGWGGYLASPYAALYRLGLAIESRNVPEVAVRVNVRALRASLAKQVATDLAATESAGSGVSPADAQLAAGTLLSLTDPMLETLVSPDGVIRLLTPPMRDPAAKSIFGASEVELDDLDDFIAASTWRGFRNVYFSLPPGEPPETRYRLQMRLAGFGWRIVGIDLPATIRARIVAEIVKRRLP